MVAIPKGLNGVCTIGVNLLLLRYLGPAQFGWLSLCLASVLLGDSILGAGFDLGVLKLASEHRMASPEHALSIQKSALYAKFVGLAVISAFVVVFGGRISEAAFPRQHVSNSLYLCCGILLALSVVRSAQLQMQLEQSFHWYGAIDMLQNVLEFGGIALLMVFGRVQVAYVLLAYLSGPVAALCIWAFVKGRALLVPIALRLDLVRELLRFAKWSFATFSLAALLGKLDLFLLARFAGVREAGIFAAAQMIAWVPQMLGMYLGIVFGPRIMPALREGRFGRFFRQFQCGVIAVSVAAYVLAVLGRKLLGHWLLPASFHESSEVALALLPGALAGLTSFPLTINLLMFVRPRFLLMMDCMALPVMVLLYLYVIPRFGALGAAWVTSSINLVRAGVAQTAGWLAASANDRKVKSDFLASRLSNQVPLGA